MHTSLLVNFKLYSRYYLFLPCPPQDEPAHRVLQLKATELLEKYSNDSYGLKSKGQCLPLLFIFFANIQMDSLNALLDDLINISVPFNLLSVNGDESDRRGFIWRPNTELVYVSSEINELPSGVDFSFGGLALAGKEAFASGAFAQRVLH